MSRFLPEVPPSGEDDRELAEVLRRVAAIEAQLAQLPVLPPPWRAAEIRATNARFERHAQRRRDAAFLDRMERRRAGRSNQAPQTEKGDHRV